jgi:hypothetical protein
MQESLVLDSMVFAVPRPQMVTLHVVMRKEREGGGGGRREKERKRERKR